jgi:dihydrofolate synthase/folylpolyglutamate synthase
VNLIDADLALVTSIGVDHVEWLGNTRESVAFEKAGIFREGRPALCGDTEPPQPLLEQARVLNCPLSLRGRDFDLTVEAMKWHWFGTDANGQRIELRDLPLLDLPMQNAALALQAYLLLQLPWEEASIHSALLRTRVTGRLDRRSIEWQGKPLRLLLDVGHNPHAAVFLAQRLAQRPLNGKRLAVFGLLNDKDLDGVLTELTGCFSHWAVAPLPTSRSRSEQEIAQALQNLGAPVTSYPSIALALEAQCTQATAEDEIVLFGSFYCVAEALEWLAGHASRRE